MPQYLFNKEQLKKLLKESPKNTNVIGIYVKYVKNGKQIVQKIEARAVTFNTKTGVITDPRGEENKANMLKSGSANKNTAASSSSSGAPGSPVCPNPPGCTADINKILNLD